jgi:putative heme iron utilization protein
MIAHMNEDHADAVLGYVHRLGSLPAAESARLIAIEPTHMLIHATTGSATTPLDVPFDHVLRDAADARDTLIAMARAGHDGSQTVREA